MFFDFYGGMIRGLQSWSISSNSPKQGIEYNLSIYLKKKSKTSNVLISVRATRYNDKFKERRKMHR